MFLDQGLNPMEKHYLFQTSGPFHRIAFEDSLASIGVEGVTYFSLTSGEFIADASAVAELIPILGLLREDLGVSISFLISHDLGPLEKKLLNEAFSYYPNQALFLSDLILKEISFGNYSSYPLIKEKFEHVPSDLMLTVGMYLRCGLDGKAASKCLFIHRNTFLYRVNQFIEMTGLDIRDYHNALFLELYFQLVSAYRAND